MFEKVWSAKTMVSLMEESELILRRCNMNLRQWKLRYGPYLTLNFRISIHGVLYKLHARLAARYKDTQQNALNFLQSRSPGLVTHARAL